MILAFLGLFPTVLAGYVDWQHFYGGTWLFPIKMKMLLAGAFPRLRGGPLIPLVPVRWVKRSSLIDSYLVLVSVLLMPPISVYGSLWPGCLHGRL